MDNVRITFILHMRIIDLLIAKRFTGWCCYPVVVYGRKGETHKDYCGLAFSGRCGPIDDSKSELIQKTYPERTAPVLKGMYFDAMTLDGLISLCALTIAVTSL